MGISLRLADLDGLFHQQLTQEPIIINTFDESSAKRKEDFNKLLYKTYQGDVLTNLPSCECGAIRGEYNLGVHCHQCNTEVHPQIEQELEPLLWVKAPEGVHRLINPIVWSMMRKHFSSSGFEVIRWLCDTTYRSDVKEPERVRRLRDANVPRGLNNFYTHFDEIIDLLFSIRPGNANRQEEMHPLHRLLKENKRLVFPEHIPLPNRALLVVEETHSAKYSDRTVYGAVNAVRTMLGVDTDYSNHTQKVKENRAIKMIAELADYYEDVYKDIFAQKEGWFRKHVFGSRSHFSFRAVISSITEPHDHEEIHIPWGIGVSVFRIHLMNKLMRLGYTPVEGINLLNSHATTYHPLLDQMFKELIKESPWPGIPAVLQRNPSLERGSAQSVFITKVKTAAEIPTVSISILVVKGLNADFDGKLRLPSLNPLNCWKLPLGQSAAKPSECRRNVQRLSKAQSNLEASRVGDQAAPKRWAVI